MWLKYAQVCLQESLYKTRICKLAFQHIAVSCAPSLVQKTHFLLTILDIWACSLLRIFCVRSWRNLLYDGRAGKGRKRGISQVAVFKTNWETDLLGPIKRATAFFALFAEEEDWGPKGCILVVPKVRAHQFARFNLCIKPSGTGPLNLTNWVPNIS